MSQNLQYFYAQINLETGECLSVFTSSYEIPLPDYIEISSLNYDYMHKYYNDGLWYEDSGFTVLADYLN